MTRRALTLLICAAVLCSGAGMVGAIVVLNRLFEVPTTDLQVVNDTQWAYTVSVCTSDPAILSPGESTSAWAASCLIYDRAHYVGCLFIPAAVAEQGGTVRISQVRREVAADKCPGPYVR